MIVNRCSEIIVNSCVSAVTDGKCSLWVICNWVKVRVVGEWHLVESDQKFMAWIRDTVSTCIYFSSFQLKGKTKEGLSWDLNLAILCVYGEDQKLQRNTLPMYVCWSEHLYYLHSIWCFFTLVYIPHGPATRNPHKGSCWSSNNSYNWPNQQIHMILYKCTHTKFYNFFSYCCYWPLPQLSCRLCS